MQTHSLACIFLFVQFFGPATGLALDLPTLKASEIMQKVGSRDRGDQMFSQINITMTDREEKKFSQEMFYFHKKRGNDFLTAMFFKHPESVRNTGILFYDYWDLASIDDLWIYHPYQKRVQRIKPREKSENLKNTNISCWDLLAFDPKKYTYKLMKSTWVGGSRAWQIQATPGRNKYKTESGYQRSILYIRQDSFVIVKAIHWLISNHHVKIFEILTQERIAGIWVPSKMVMTYKIKEKIMNETVLKQTNIRFDQAISDSFFSVNKLRQGIRFSDLEQR